MELNYTVLWLISMLAVLGNANDMEMMDQCISAMSPCVEKLLQAAKDADHIPANATVDEVMQELHYLFNDSRSMGHIQHTICSKYRDLNETFECFAEVFERNSNCSDFNDTMRNESMHDHMHNDTMHNDTMHNDTMHNNTMLERPDMRKPRMSEMIKHFGHLCDPGCHDLDKLTAELDMCTQDLRQQPTCSDFSTVVPCVNKVAGCCPILQLPFKPYVPMIKDMCPDQDPKFICHPEAKCEAPTMACTGKLVKTLKDSGKLSSDADDMHVMESLKHLMNIKDLEADQEKICGAAEGVDLKPIFTCLAGAMTPCIPKEAPRAGALVMNYTSIIQGIGHLCDPGCKELHDKNKETKDCMKPYENRQPNCSDYETLVPCINKVAGCCPILQESFKGYIPIIKAQCSDMDPKFSCDTTGSGHGDNGGVQMERHWTLAVLLHLFWGGLLALHY